TWPPTRWGRAPPFENLHVMHVQGAAHRGAADRRAGRGKSLVHNRVGRNDYQGQQTHGHQTYELADGPYMPGGSLEVLVRGRYLLRDVVQGASNVAQVHAAADGELAAQGFHRTLDGYQSKYHVMQRGLVGFPAHSSHFTEVTTSVSDSPAYCG